MEFKNRKTSFDKADEIKAIKKLYVLFFSHHH